MKETKDYEEVVNRLCSRKFVEKFLVKFLADKSYEDLHRYLDEENYEEAFRAAHTLKGVCQNLGIKSLYESNYLLFRALRSNLSRLRCSRLGTRMMQISAAVKPRFTFSDSPESRYSRKSEIGRAHV